MNCLIDEINNNASGTSLIMIDIDYFKLVNDTYGHCTGDEVIKRISQALQSNIRKIDVLGRIGGEEFLIMMPDITLEDATVRANTICKMVSELEWPYENLHITISGGVYCTKGDDTVDEVLDNVDLRLYKAKDTGRNKIVSHLE